MNQLDYWCIVLTKAGYGSVDLLKSYGSDIFFNILDYENFVNDYQSELRALNRRE